jgi:hypothetical protein
VPPAIDNHAQHPAMVEEWALIIIVKPGQRLEVGGFGELIISSA